MRYSRKPRTSNVKKKTTSFLGGKHQQARCREEDVKAPIASLPMYIARPVIVHSPVAGDRGETSMAAIAEEWQMSMDQLVVIVGGFSLPHGGERFDRIQRHAQKLRQHP